jgi:hypothetical protein
MGIMKLHILSGFALLMLWSCGESKPMADNQKRAIIDNIQYTLDSYYEDIKREGLTAEFKYLDQSPEFFWVPPGYTSALSYDSIEHILKQNLSKFKSVDNSFDTLRIIPLSGELATYTAQIHSTVTDTFNKISTYSLIETGVVIKRKTGWKLLSRQTSLVSPERN